MKIYLKNYSIFGSFFERNLETGETNETNSLNGSLPSGIADKLCKSYVGFYEYKSDIYFFVGDERFKLDENSQFEHEYLGELRKLTLTVGGSVKKTVEYEAPKYLEDDFTSFIEEEDFDFGLFLKNIFIDKDRKRLVLREMKKWG